MTDDIIVIPARCGKAIPINAGDRLKIVNMHGSQVLNTWTFSGPGAQTYMSMQYTRSYNSRRTPRGDKLVSNAYQPRMFLLEDTSPSMHDTLMCSCCWAIHERMDCVNYHDNCEDNLHTALAEVGIKLTHTPGPLNLLTNFPVSADGSIDRQPPGSKSGDTVVLKAEIDLFVILSACPQDMSPVNGEEMAPADGHCQIL